MMKTFPTFDYEDRFWTQNRVVIGIDEVGRGCIAGPVTVAAVCIELGSEEERKNWLSLGINDSKKLTAKKREKLAKDIREQARCFSIQSSTVEQINEIGIVGAIRHALLRNIQEVCATLKRDDVIICIDGFPHRDIPFQQEAIVKGDQLSISIAAASIIAKVARDEMMSQLSQEEKYQPYDWQTNKGYGTAVHRTALQAYGPTDLHRTLFIRKIVPTSP